MLISDGFKNYVGKHGSTNLSEESVCDSENITDILDGIIIKNKTHNVADDHLLRAPSSENLKIAT